jgi:hypothetical protein
LAVLVLLARFRFPEEAGRPVAEPVQAPLERLAARATYDELAAIMADLERRLLPEACSWSRSSPTVTGDRMRGGAVTPNRAVTLLAWHETLTGTGAPAILARDNARDLAVLSVPERPTRVVTLRPTQPDPGPRYVAVVEATARGLVIRPVYVGRTDMFQDPRTTSPLLSIAALQQVLPRGAAVFSLAGNFLGLAIEGGSSATVVPGDILRAAAESARRAQETRGDLGFTVEPLTRPLMRATGAERGRRRQLRAPARSGVRQGRSRGRRHGDRRHAGDDARGLSAGRPEPYAWGPKRRSIVMRRGKPLTMQVAVRDATGVPLAAATCG